MAGEEEQRKGEGKGFAGLASLVSDVDISPSPESARESPGLSQEEAPQPAVGAIGSQDPEPQAPPSKPSSGSSGGKWLLGIAAVIGVFWMISQFHTSSDLTSSAGAPPISTPNSGHGTTPTTTPESVAPKFTAYPSSIYEGARAKPILLTDFDRRYKTRIQKTQSQPVNYAGEYVLSTWGCGTSCLMGVAVSARTGTVVALPGTVCCWQGSGESTIFRKNSRLIVLAGLINETGQHGAHFYELRDNSFVRIKTMPVKEVEPGDTSPPLVTAPTTPTIPPSPTPTLDSSRPAEHMPPVGQDLVFSPAQIRYCLAEDIRLDGAKSAVNNYIDSDVDRFNAMVADYNSRCASYRYRSGSLERARQDIEPYRSQLEVEGRMRLGRRVTELPSMPMPSLPNSSPSTSNRQAYVPPGLDSLARDEQSAIRQACILSKSEGAASYNRCVDEQISALANAPQLPDLSKLAYDERSAIQQACILSKSDGAASYNRCVVAQTNELANAPRLPDLSKLTYDERSAIQQACILSKSDGAASYNRCVVVQLLAIGK